MIIIQGKQIFIKNLKPGDTFLLEPNGVILWLVIGSDSGAGTVETVVVHGGAYNYKELSEDAMVVKAEIVDISVKIL